MKTTSTYKLEIELPGETITVGPGTVPISLASVSTTSVKGMISGLRRASRLGLFDKSSALKQNGAEQNL